MQWASMIPSSQRRHVISSYGLVCHRIRIDFDAREVYPEYLLVQRKDTIAFVEFLRGKYDPANHDYVRGLISQMTHDEQQALCTKPFEQLWTELWGPWRRCTPRNDTEMHAAHSHYDRLCAAFRGIACLVKTVHTAAPEREWTFPKGRKSGGSESDITCAVREFEEETGYSSSHIHIHCVAPYEEVFEGGNGLLYRHMYFLARVIDMRGQPDQDAPTGSIRSRETRCMRWFTYSQMCEKFASAPTRLQVVARANTDIVNILAPGIVG